MTAYVKSVVENSEIVNPIIDSYYLELQGETLHELEATFLSIEDIENVSTIEHKLYAYINNQGLELLTSDLEYTTALINYPCYQAINLETNLLSEEKADERLFSLAHELGHYLDVKFNHNGNAMSFNEWYKDNTEIMELVAWAYGWKVLEALGCTKKSEFLFLAYNCLHTYTGSYQKVLFGLKNIDKIVSNYEEKVKQPIEVTC